jgi:predicted nucleic acid-binding protein
VKLVIDTNTLISGALWQGPAARLLSEAFAGRAQIFLSLSMLLEFRERWNIHGLIHGSRANENLRKP